MKREDEIYLKKLGARIKMIRKAKNMTQVTLSEKIEIEDSALRRIESGRVNSSINMLRKIAKGLGITLQELIDFK